MSIEIAREIFDLSPLLVQDIIQKHAKYIISDIINPLFDSNCILNKHNFNTWYKNHKNNIDRVQRRWLNYTIDDWRKKIYEGNELISFYVDDKYNIKIDIYYLSENEYINIPINTHQIPMDKLWCGVKYLDIQKSNLYFDEPDEMNYFINNPKCSNLCLDSPNILAFYKKIFNITEDMFGMYNLFITRVNFKNDFFWISYMIK